MEKDIPRRSRIDLFCPAEHAIRAAQLAVEEMGADVRLTKAGNLLAEARDLIADVYEDQDKTR